MACGSPFLMFMIGKFTHVDEKSAAIGALFSGAETKHCPRTRYDTFSPAREKVSKERAFVRADGVPIFGTPEERQSLSSALYSGGIVMLFAQMRLV